MLRFLHFSDIHVTASPLGWRKRDVFGKRIVGLVNIKFLGRGYRFRHAAGIVEAMTRQAGPFDCALFSGDATKLGFENEFVQAIAKLGVGPATPGFAVPGNHDYYTLGISRLGLFEKHFAPWMHGQRIAGHAYPYARRVGHVWLIGVNSANPRRVSLAAAGSVGREQLQRLRTLCADLAPGPRILVTHYPLRTAAGRIERRGHRLLDHREALAAAVECKISLWLHGHIHSPFILTPTKEIPFPVICVGSATQEGIAAHNVYEIEGRILRMTRRVWDGSGFVETMSATMELPL